MTASHGSGNQEGSAQIRWRVCGWTAIVEFCVGEVTDNAHAKEIGDDLLRLAEGDRFPEMIVDFGGLKYVPSALLARLITLYRRTRDWDGRLKVCGLGREAEAAFRMLNLHKLMPMFATAEDGLSAQSC